MTQENLSGCTPLGFFYGSPRLRQGLSMIGSLGVLSTSFMVVPTKSPAETVVVPTTNSASPSAPAAPAPVAPSSAAQPRPTPPASFVVPARPAPAPAPAPVVKKPAPRPVHAPAAKKPAPAPAPVVKKPAPAPTARKPTPTPVHAPAARKPTIRPSAPTASAPTMTTPVSKQPVLAAPNLSPPSNPVAAQPPKVILNPGSSQRAAGTNTTPSNNFIDRTNYSAGANTRPSQPPKVVLTERSTGCAVNSGSPSGQACGVTKPSQPVANYTGRPTQPVSSPTRQLSRPPVAAATNVGSAPTRPRPIVTPSPVRVASRVVRSVARPKFNAYSNKRQVKPDNLAYYKFTRRPPGYSKVERDSFIFPLVLPSAITSRFGWRMHPIMNTHRFHSGTDLGAPQGTAVIASAPGEVATASSLSGYGLTVILRHEEGTQESLYAHLSEVFVQPGEWVEQGTVIGRVGNSGLSTGPHLHFEWRHLTPNGWVAVDAGAHLEYALAQFIQALEVAQVAEQSESPGTPKSQS